MTDKRRILDTGSLQPAVVPLVRIPAIGQENFLAMTKQVLDVGVFGVMFPSINNAQEAEKAIRAMRYPQPRGAQDSEPRGLRGRNPSNAVWYWGVDDYVERADVWPGVGGIFIGPSDLATDMGYERASHPAVEEAIASVLAVCVRRNIPCAITTNPESVERRLQQGFRIVTVGVDGGLSARAQQALQRARAMGQ
jgi:4-hydroxy-2-oxoheptanedioate aldolase